MKKKAYKFLSCLLAVVLVCSLLAGCGGGEPDPNLGIYKAVACQVMGFEMDYEGDYVELKKGGKATICLMGETYNGKWSLEGESLTITQKGSEFTGRLVPGAMFVDFSGMEYTYLMDGADISALCVLNGHVSTEPNQQDEGVCTVCGEVTAEKLPAEMELNGITEFMELGKTYEFETTGPEGYTDLVTTGLITAESYEIFESAEGFEFKEGYEWRKVVFACWFDTKGSNNKGFWLPSRLEDYYNTTLHDDTSTLLWENDDESFEEYTILWHGQEMKAERYWESHNTGWHRNEEGYKEMTKYFTYAVHVPVGYDGAVFGVSDKSIDLDDDAEWYIHERYSPEDFLLFRLK